MNQQRQVVEEVVRYGAALGVGLEAGSKPELLVALALLDTPDALIVCNGYKDRAYIELALLAQRLGRTPIVVIDRFHEIDLVIKTARELGIQPHLGVRARLTTKGAGKWVESTGDRSKFGLSALEIVDAVERLRAEDMLDCLELLHFHIGSQITAIRALKDAVKEASRVFVGLHEMGARPTLLDVGGGLGVDYDGSKTNFHSSKNYSTQEYANDVVAHIQEACDEAGVPHPDIVTEAGRAMVAHHSVLVFDVLGVNEMLSGKKPDPVSEEDPKVLQDLSEVWTTVSRKNVQESYHDALQLKEEASTLFSLGFIDLRARARVERLFWDCLEKILRIVRDLPSVPEDLEDLEKGLADTYYGNLSVFQSAPDHWAVKQLFPVMPIHRLDEKPTRRGVFADLTCDSDGKIDKFIDQHDVKDVLELHSWNGGALLHRRVPGGRLPGDPGRPAQSLRRHRRRPRAARRRGRLHRRPRRRGRFRGRGALLRAVRPQRPDREGAPDDRGRPAQERDHDRGVGPPAQALRAGPAGIHLPEARRLSPRARRVMPAPASVRILSWNVNGLRACASKGFERVLGRCAGRDRGGAGGARAPGAAPGRAAGAAALARAPSAPRRGRATAASRSTRAARPTRSRRRSATREFDREGRLQLARFGRLVVANVYFPNGNGKERDNSRIPYKLDFYRALFEKLERLRRAGAACS